MAEMAVMAASATDPYVSGVDEPLGDLCFYPATQDISL